MNTLQQPMLGQFLEHATMEAIRRFDRQSLVMRVEIKMDPSR